VTAGGAILDPSDLVSIDQLIARAIANTEPGLFGWAAAAAGEEVTIARNAIALNRLALVSRTMRDVGSVDTSTTLLGVPLSVPVFMAPVGALSLYHPDGAMGSAQAAAEAGTTAFCGMLVSEPWEDLAATAPGRNFFQLYVGGDRGWLAGIIERIESAGFAGLCVTVDTPVIGRRDRSLVDGFIWSAERHESPFNLARHGGADMTHRKRFTWDEFEWICAHTRLPVIVKGVLNPADAARAVEVGAAAVYVSNHGGRVVDHSVSSIEMLPEVVDAVAGRAQVIVDSGFTRGPEVIKALALGATAVGLGRMQCWGLAVGGRAGVARLLTILRQEIEITMANLGAASVAELTPEFVRWSFPTR
jgi:isopentenyl diphosphate isomerase/L-lactate dehydrogenase-like FMN-dependent dehydrogenase